MANIIWGFQQLRSRPEQQVKMLALPRFETAGTGLDERLQTSMVIDLV